MTMKKNASHDRRNRIGQLVADPGCWPALNLVALNVLIAGLVARRGSI